jgi:hypothetical protein
MIERGTEFGADYMRFMDAADMFRDVDGLFRRYMKGNQFDDISHFSGLRMKTPNTIIKPWPMRLGDNASKREFELLQASGHIEWERYVEWESLN